MSDNIEMTGPAYRLARRSGLDPATKRLMLIAACLGGALFVVIGAWSAVGAGKGGVPVIAAPEGPVRVKPANPGGMQVSQNSLILSGALSDSGADKLAPPPETPDPQALTAAPNASPDAAPTPDKGARAPSAVVQPPSARTPSVSPEAASVAKPSLVAAAAVKLPPLQPSPAASGTAKRAEPQHATAERSQLVQLAAVSTREAAEGEWRILERRMPDLLASHAPQFSRTEHDGHTFWRVRTGGFADTAAARTFCERVRAKGGACAVTPL